MKKYHCCIPGCNTYGALINFINIPFESCWRNQWLSTIPKKDWVVDSTTVACLKHFHLPSLVTPFLTIPDENGKKASTIDYNNVKAVPQLFSRCDEKSNDASKAYYPLSMFELYNRDCEGSGPDTFGDIENDDTDYLINYWYFKLMYPRRLKTLLENMWQSIATNENTVFYTVDFSETARIISTIKIDSNFHVQVILDGRIMDPCDLAWVLPVTTNKIQRWSQLQIMLSLYGK